MAYIKNGFLFSHSAAAMIAYAANVLVTPAAAEVASTPGVEEVVVTGSLVPRADLQSASPVSVIGQDKIQASGAASIDQVMDSIPQVVATDNQNSGDGTGISTLDLRGMGPSRTLVLVDGMRYVASGANQVVDINSIPSALVDHVDVVTGGRSAVYGSDAIAGVINFVLKKNFDGAEADIHEGISEKGGGNELNLSGIIGTDFADNRGNIAVYGGYLKRDPVFSSQYPYAANCVEDSGTGTLVPGCSSAIPGGRLVGLSGPSELFASNGTVSPYNSSTEQYNYNPYLNLQVAQVQNNAYAIGHYDIAPWATFYSEITYVKSDTDLGYSPQKATSIPITIQVASPFLAASAQAYLSAFQTGNSGYVSAGLTRRMTEFGNAANQYDRQNYRIVTGFKGDIGHGWNYDAYFNYSENSTLNTYFGTMSQSRLQEALYTAYANPITLNTATPTISALPIAGLSGGGALVCADAIARASGCVPANLYGQNNISAAATSYLAETIHNTSSTSTEVVSVLLNNGDVWDIPFGGPVGVALGAEYRRLAAASTPDAAIVSGDAIGQGQASPLSGSYDVAEIYGELNAVLLEHAPLAEALEFNAAGRYSDYSLKGTHGVTSWSAGLVYKPIEEISLRSEFQAATRAPNVGELFSSPSLTQTPGSDPCNGAAAGTTLGARCLATGVPHGLIGTVLDPNTQLEDLIGGNPNLKAETSSTWTLGTVWEPSFLPRFMGSIDYYNTSIKNYITQVGASTIAQLCYQQGITAYCNLITRSPLAGNITQVQDVLANAGSFSSAGEDIIVQYGYPITFGKGVLDGVLAIRSNVTHAEERTLTPVSALPSVRDVCAGKFGVVCGNPSPHWKAQTDISWNSDFLTVTGQWNYIGSVIDDGGLGYPLAVTKISAFNYFNISAQYKVADWLSVTAGVINVGDKLPPVMGDNSDASWANSWPATYDTIGRRFFINISSKL